MTAALLNERVARIMTALNRVERRQNPAADARAAGRILLASIIGMAICTFWIAITWRAWG